MLRLALKGISLIMHFYEEICVGSSHMGTGNLVCLKNLANISHWTLLGAFIRLVR
jgi:hypothetical protein